MKNNKLPVKILDCTVRDGGYVNNWQFDKVVVREVYRACSKAGVDIVELGFRSNEKYFNKETFGIWRFSLEEDIREVKEGIVGPKISIMGDFGKIDIGDIDEKKSSAVDIVRIAAHKDEIFNAIKFLEKVKKKGFEVSLQAMAYATYTTKEKDELNKALTDVQLDYVYVADSYGSIFPNQINDFLGPLLNIPKIKVGFHPHNGLQMAFANTLEAIRCGAHIVDSSFYGMGRGAGNLPTEILVSYLENQYPDKYNVIPVLSVIDEFFVALKREKEWGYRLPYMLSGMFQLHPNFAKKLVEFREYSIEDVWKALAYIKKLNPLGYSEALLDEIIKEGIIRHIDMDKKVVSSSQNVQLTLSITQPEPKNIHVPYKDRYKGKDFLVLANGPTLAEYKDKIKMFIDKYDPIILGANYLGGLFKPHYHAFNNKRRFIKYVNIVVPESKLLIGQHIEKSFIRGYTKREYEVLYYKDVLDAHFDIQNGVIQANCRTISILLLGIAIVMGAKRIFSVGMDGYMNFGPQSDFHFYAERDEQMIDREFVLTRHRWCEAFINQIDRYLTSRKKEGIIILTPTSYKEFYKGIENYI